MNTMKRTKHHLWNSLLSVAIIMSVANNAPMVQAQTGIWYVAPGGSDTNDCLTPSTPCATLARAIFNAAPGGTIRVAIGTYTDVGEEVVLINKDISLSGGWNSTFTSLVGRSTVDGQNARHGIVLTEGVTASIDRFTIRNGWVPRHYFNYLGGGINNNGGNLTLTNSEVISNTAQSIYSYGMGGGIHNRLGTLTIISSTIAGNRSYFYGAGLSISSGTVVIRDSSIIGNSVDGCCSGGAGGGGIYNGGALSIERSVLDSNRTSGFSGSAIYSGGVLTITNSTISRNTGSSIVIDNSRGIINLNNVTISRNDGIGIANTIAGVINIRNSIIAHNTISDCDNATDSTFNSFGYNLIRSPGGCNIRPTDLVGVEPLLADPQGTPLHLSPLLGSPAINGGNPNGCVDGSGALLIVDQRNVARSGRCDIGAIEAQLAFDKRVTGLFYPGGVVTYTILLSNTTDSQNLTSVSITDAIPSELAYLPGSLSATTGSASVINNTLSWQGSVGVAEQATIAFSAEIALSPALFGKSITNTAFINWPGQAYTDTASFLTPNQLYTLTKAVRGDFRPAGLITYTIVLDNRGQGIDLTGVALTDTLPSALIYMPDSLTASNGTASISNGNTIRWTGYVLSSGTTTISYAAQIGAPTGQPIINTVESRWRSLSQTASAQFMPINYIHVPLVARNYCADFFDDFSSPTSGWPTDDSEYVLAQYLNGEYRVQSKQPYLFLFRSPSCERDNYVVEADMRWNGMTGSDIGLIFGLLPGFSQYYFVDINTDFQAYSIFRRNSNGTFSIVAPAAQTNAIRTGTQANHLKITRTGGQIMLEINGVYIGSWFDGTITGPTRTGVAMAPYDDQPLADARFDNFRVTTISSGVPGISTPGLPRSSSPGKQLPEDFSWQLPARELAR
jgi:uncharacterized repeat protein (TIGR01451 family)